MVGRAQEDMIASKILSLVSKTLYEDYIWKGFSKFILNSRPLDPYNKMTFWAAPVDMLKLYYI